MKVGVPSATTDLNFNRALGRIQDFSGRPEVDIVLATSIACLVAAFTLFWFSFDHRFPSQDEARHILNCMTFKDLLAHSRPWQYQWWHHCVTVDPFYPPFAYLVNGFFLLVFGQSRFVEQLGVAFFSGLLVLAVYGLTRLSRGTRRAACLAGLFASTYPIVSKMSHTYFLDLPNVAMTAVALLVLLRWRSCPKPTLASTLLSGFAIGLFCLTKQTVAIYVLPAGLYLLFRDLAFELYNLKTKENDSRLAWLVHTVILGMTTMMVGLPFIVANYQWNVDRMNWNMKAFANYSVQLPYAVRLSVHGHNLPEAMSPLMFTVFIISMLSVRFRKHPQLIPMVVSAIGGVCLLSMFPSESQDSRYLTPCFIAPAIMSGILIDKLLSLTSVWWRATGIAVVVLAVCSYFIRDFSPYPYPLLQQPWLGWLAKDSQNPVPYVDWGHSFVLETIKRTDGSKPVYLNILPNHNALHVSAFALFLSEQKNHTILPTTTRVWTIVGDLVKFDPIAARYPMWYLLKTGDIGFPFADQHSKVEYERLIDFVKGNDYRQVAQKSLPDGSLLILYRRRY